MNIKTKKVVKIKVLNPDCVPNYTKTQQAALDCFANITEPVVLKPMERVAIPLGFCVDLDNDWELDIKPRSGLAFKYGITILNTPGLVDEDFVDEIKAILINLGTEDFTINPLDRVCQCQINHVTRVQWQAVTDISVKSEEHKGFGSTGINA